MDFAINYVLGGSTLVLVVQASDTDEAYDAARSTLRARGLISASLQGSCRPASQADLDAAVAA